MCQNRNTVSLVPLYRQEAYYRKPLTNNQDWVDQEYQIDHKQLINWFTLEFHAPDNSFDRFKRDGTQNTNNRSTTNAQKFNTSPNCWLTVSVINSLKFAVALVHPDHGLLTSIPIV